MGWFSARQSESDNGRRPGARANQSSESQLRELRVRARRRLVGALALVLLAVIFVPMFFNVDTAQESRPVPVVVPAINGPEPSSGELALATAGQPQAPAAGITEGAAPGVTAESSPATDAPASTTAAESSTHSAAPEPAPQTPATPVPPKPASPAPAPSNTSPRTDDGSVALALLEGRSPASVAPPERGNFILQIAAYTTEGDARSRRDKLVASGVTNAYVEQASVDGKATYRLRVGPFPTRDAAQAAQARLRALGYDNGFISSK
ncbi:MAG: SPOR domain-containing protein [Burkholderiaceae bacterium]|jgi:DedD protein